MTIILDASSRSDVYVDEIRSDVAFAHIFSFSISIIFSTTSNDSTRTKSFNLSSHSNSVRSTQKFSSISQSCVTELQLNHALSSQQLIFGPPSDCLYRRALILLFCTLHFNGSRFHDAATDIRHESLQRVNIKGFGPEPMSNVDTRNGARSHSSTY